MTIDGESVRIVKQVGAPVDRVYRAFIDPEEIVRWMHPDSFHTVSAANDAVVGGRGEVIHGQGGEAMGGFHWEYTEIVPNIRLVMDCQFLMLGQEPDVNSSRMKIEFREIEPGSTEVTLIHDRLGEAPPGGHMGVNIGWTQALDSLQRHIEEGEESK